MSCPNSNSPTDISMSNIIGKCDLKCNYSYRYGSSSCIATNRGDYLSLSYDSSSTSAVLYNSSEYSTKEVRIYSPSLHSYNGVKSDGEMIIIHESKTGANQLLVCIPIKISSSQSASALFLSNVVNTVSKNAPSEGETTTVNISNYNLSNFIPKNGFYSYTGLEPYQPCIQTTDYVVYSSADSGLDIFPDTLDKLNSVIEKNAYDVKKGTNLFYNSKGSSKWGGLEDQIYIDCQPVNDGNEEDNEEVYVAYDNGSSGKKYTFDDFVKNPMVQLIFGSLLFIVILCIISYMMGYIRPSTNYNDVFNRHNDNINYYL